MMSTPPFYMMYVFFDIYERKIHRQSHGEQGGGDI